MTVRRRMTMTLAAVGVGALTACSGAGTSDTAAVVNGHSIAVTDVAQTTRQINAAMAGQSGGREVPELQVLNLAILSDFVMPEATKAGWMPDNQLGSALAEIPNPTPLTRQVFTTSFAIQGLDNAARERIGQALKSATVQVNPRYGSFNPTSGSLEPTAPDWVKPVSTAPKP